MTNDIDNFDSIDDFDEAIVTLCQTPNTALQAIHRLLAKGSIRSSSLNAIYERVMSDKDVDGAYYLAVLAQKIDDLPFDALPLVELVLTQGDEHAKLSLWEKLPKAAKLSLQEQGFDF